jgi:nucleotide-binding universal stress UspA family protein
VAGALQASPCMSKPIERILVAHDFGETAQAALDYALDLAQTLRAHVSILHAYEIPVYGFPEGLTLTADVAGRIEEVAAQALESIVRRAGRPGLEVVGVLRQGPAWSEIAAAAADLRADLVVIGTHGRRGLAHALLGSVAEKVVRTAPCPVLTVRGSSREHA